MTDQVATGAGVVYVGEQTSTGGAFPPQDPATPAGVLQIVVCVDDPPAGTYRSPTVVVFV